MMPSFLTESLKESRYLPVFQENPAFEIGGKLAFLAGSVSLAACLIFDHHPAVPLAMAALAALGCASIYLHRLPREGLRPLAEVPASPLEELRKELVQKVVEEAKSLKARFSPKTEEAIEPEASIQEIKSFVPDHYPLLKRLFKEALQEVAISSKKGNISITIALKGPQVFPSFHLNHIDSKEEGSFLTLPQTILFTLQADGALHFPDPTKAPSEIKKGPFGIALPSGIWEKIEVKKGHFDVTRSYI
ncbi:MAG: hypothetical protein K0S07_1273 [Chlamydiales bacterium]|jgi:hypothetical protein|nr:hypothetical protein [Chlamydiales bacterium]